MEISHPTLYVIIGEKPGKIESYARETHPEKAAFFLYLKHLENTETEIRKKISEIQLGEIGLSVKRLNIYVVCEAHGNYDLLEKISTRLKTIIRENFLTSYFTLAVFEQRNRDKFLTKLSAKSTQFDRYFLFSDKNEYDIVNPKNIENGCLALAYLPKLTASCFDDILAAKSSETGKVIFASAGVARCEKYNCEFDALAKLAHCLDQNLNEGVKDEIKSEIELKSKDMQDLASVAAVPISPWDLLGRSIKDSEELLFSNRAAEFYKKNFSIAAKKNYEPRPIILPLNKLITEEHRLENFKNAISNKISTLSQELKHIENTTLRNIFGGIRFIKDMICKRYSIIHDIEQLEQELTIASQEYNQIKDYTNYIRHVMQSLKNYPITKTKSTEELEKEVAVNISLLRDDGLIKEKYVLDGCVLKIIGGFSLNDL